MQSYQNFQVKVLRMDTSRNTDFFSKMDPYVKVIYNGQEQRTQVHNKGGQHVQFQDTFTFPYHADQQTIRFECWDKDKKHDDLIGTSEFQFSMIHNDNQAKVNLPLKYKNKDDAGSLQVQVELH